MRFVVRFCGGLTVLGVVVGTYVASTGLPDVGISLVLLALAVVPSGLFLVRTPRPWRGNGLGDDAAQPTAEPAPGQGVLLVHRPAGYPYAVSRRYGIEVDGRVAAKVSRGRTAAVPLSAGRHVVRARIDWGSSSAVEVDLAPGERVQLAVTPGPPVAAFTRPSETLVLESRPPGGLRAGSRDAAVVTDAAPAEHRGRAWPALLAVLSVASSVAVVVLAVGGHWLLAAIAFGISLLADVLVAILVRTRCRAT